MSFIAIFLSSLLGGSHCVGMCGGFSGMVAQYGTVRALFLYHGGRLFSYLTVGVVSWWLGSAVIEKRGVVDSLMIILPLFVTIFLLLKKNPWGALIKPVFSMKNKSLSHLFLGVFSSLLPCGWLYGFVAVAAIQPSIERAVLVIVLFWLGTIPWVFAAGDILRRFTGGWTRHASAALLLLSALFSLILHFSSFHAGSHTDKGSSLVICTP